MVAPRAPANWRPLCAARDERGAELIESAYSMLIILMFMFIFGLVETCWAECALHRVVRVVNVAHEAACYASSAEEAGPALATAPGPPFPDTVRPLPGVPTRVVANRNFPGLNITVNEICGELPSLHRAHPHRAAAISVRMRVSDTFPIAVTYPLTFLLRSLWSLTWVLASTSQMAFASNQDAVTPRTQWRSPDPIVQPFPRHTRRFPRHVNLNEQ